MTTGQIRKIIHVDMDAFFASVEQRDNPLYRFKPVIVGGSLSRGVVSACSYEARTFGVRSAMPMARAMRLCPQAIHLPVRMDRYKAFSREIFEIFSTFTDRVEPISIDEAFLDVSGCEKLFGEAREIAEHIRRRIAKECGLPASAGIAENKFLAKLASEAAKPDGLLEINPWEVDSFLLPLPVDRLWGVGPAGAKRLQAYGIKTVKDLREMSLERLIKLFGLPGERLYQLARGKDDRQVLPQESLKSIGNEETFEKDLWSVQELQNHMLRLVEKVAWRLRKGGVKAGNITLKVRYGDFTLHTHSQKLSAPTDSAEPILLVAKELLGKTAAGEKGVRLLGVSTGNLQEGEEGQLRLFPSEREEKHRKLDHAVDKIKDRFGHESVKRATFVSEKNRLSDEED